MVGVWSREVRLSICRYINIYIYSWHWICGNHTVWLDIESDCDGLSKVSGAASFNCVKARKKWFVRSNTGSAQVHETQFHWASLSVLEWVSTWFYFYVLLHALVYFVFLCVYVLLRLFDWLKHQHQYINQSPNDEIICFNNGPKSGPFSKLFHKSTKLY